MKFTTAILALAVGACAFLGGCKQPDQAIDANALGPPLYTLLDRHDTYVVHDTSLAEVERSTFLRSSDLIRKTLDTATKKPLPAANATPNPPTDDDYDPFPGMAQVTPRATPSGPPD